MRIKHKKSDGHSSKRKNGKSQSAKMAEIGTSEDTGQEFAIILFAVSILLASFILIKGTHFWNFIHNIILGLFGVASILWPILLIYVAIITSTRYYKSKIGFKIWLSVVVIFLVNTLIYSFFTYSKIVSQGYFRKLGELYTKGINGDGSGLFGGILGIPCISAFGELGARIILLLLLFVSVMLLTGMNLIQFFNLTIKPVKLLIKRIKERKQKDTNVEHSLQLDENGLPIHPVKSLPVPSSGFYEAKKLKKRKQQLNSESISESAQLATMAFLKKAKDNNFEEKKEEKYNIDAHTKENLKDGGYAYPSACLLDESDKLNQTDVRKELQTNGQMLVETLKNFSVQTKIVDISRGPAVTRYELQPAAGVKISKITNLADDIALNLAASGVRIEAPIPGKAAVGIEIPNKVVNVVKMRELINSSEFITSKSKLTVILGKDISGNVTVTDLAKMPHLLIAGSTGSGKSVCINSFIISLLYKSTPDEVRLLMIDPKVVELGIYNGIPHLLVPVVTDPRKAAGALNWAVTEMLKRYTIFAENNVRDLESYNRFVDKLKNEPIYEEKETLERMPQIVIIIDELADLMMAAPNEVEDAICRLAQMARAAGMHLVIATQRPSVDVITGVIKANIPSRIALAVSSQIDSRTILDSSGAEKLLGRGDMLFSPIGSSKPKRVQGCYVTDREIEAVIDFLKNNKKENEYDQTVIDEIEKNAVPEQDSKGKKSETSEEDPMLNDAVKCIIESGQASTSLLQRKLRLGYARAARIIDQMEDMGIVGPYEGASKSRKVLLTSQQWKDISSRR